MNDRSRTIPAGEIDHVVVSNGLAKEIPLENPVPAGLDTSGAMNQLKRRGGVREFAILHNERRAIHMQVGLRRGSESQVIQKHRAGADLDARVLRTKLESSVL